MTVPDVTPENFSFFKFLRAVESDGAASSYAGVAAVPGYIIHVVRIILSSDTATTLSITSGSTDCIGTLQFGATTNGVVEPITLNRGAEVLFSSEPSAAITINKGTAGSAVSSSIWYFLEEV